MTKHRNLVKLGTRIATMCIAATISLASASPFPVLDPGPGGGGGGATDQTALSQPAGTKQAPVQQTAVSTPKVLAEGLGELQGSTVGPDGALYVTATLGGQVWRVDVATGATSVFASGLPARGSDPFHVGSGVVDVDFLEGTAYALVTSVGPEFGAEDYAVGIYRIDGPDTHTVIADLGAWSVANQPDVEFFIATGFQFAMESYRGGFLVTDGHHNRVLWVSLDGAVTQLIAFGNVVPTGISTSGDAIYIAQAGPLPHMPEDGKVLVFDYGSTQASELAAGARLVVDVELGEGQAIFALAQGVWEGEFDGEPALPDTGSLVRADGNGGFIVLASELNRPTSMEIIGNTAYIVSLDGAIFLVENIGDAQVAQR